MTISPAFSAFLEHAPGFQQPWLAMVQQVADASALPTALAALDAAGA